MKKALFTALAVLLAFPANAQAPTCAPGVIMADRLVEHYGEQVVASEVRMAENGVEVTLELWANEKTGTWTVTGRDEFKMCALRGGQDFGPMVLEGFRQFLDSLPLKPQGTAL